MNKSKTSKKLNRFTTLPFLIQLLKTSKLTLLSPKTWEDRNDKDILLDFKDKKKKQSVLALCFTDQRETIHHWKSFSNGESGCCIEFDKDKLVAAISKDSEIIHRNVSYQLLNKTKLVTTDDIPFTKRVQYDCENEYRLVLLSDKDILSYEFHIPLDSIRKITLSPSLPDTTYSVIKEVLETLTVGLSIEIKPSTLFANEEWINGFKKRSTV